MGVSIASYIDHTKLNATATEKEIVQLCKEALTHEFAAVCVNPWFVPLVAKELQNSNVKVCTVIGFPLGANDMKVKVYETEIAVAGGAQEIDMVINLGALKNRDYQYIKDDIMGVVEAASSKAEVKVIIESCYLEPDEIIKACQISMEAGAHYVKTSTGFGSGGATVEAVRLMRQTVGDQLGVKASGGIKDRDTAIKMIEAGASRIGTSSGTTILTE